MRTFRPWALLIACSLTLASCAGEGPSAPSGNPPFSGNEYPPGDTTSTPPGDTTTTPPAGPADDSLQALLQSEEARIAVARAASSR